jgi:chromosome transmission fidelity protein 4
MANFRKPNRGCWARMLDTNALDRRQGDAFKQESYWPIGANKNNFSCIIVKVRYISRIMVTSCDVVCPQGTAAYPGFPRPFPMDLPMRLPFRGDRGEDPKKPTDLVLEEQ